MKRPEERRAQVYANARAALTAAHGALHASEAFPTTEQDFFPDVHRHLVTVEMAMAEIRAIQTEVQR